MTFIFHKHKNNNKKKMNNFLKSNPLVRLIINKIQSMTNFKSVKNKLLSTFQSRKKKITENEKINFVSSEINNIIAMKKRLKTIPLILEINLNFPIDAFLKRNQDSFFLNHSKIKTRTKTKSIK